MHLNMLSALFSNMYKVIFLVFVLLTQSCDSAPKIGLLSSHCENSQHHYVRDHVDCSIFYVCYRGRAWKMRCSPGTVWSTRYKVCVWDSSAYDDCLGEDEENSIPDFPEKPRLPPKPTNIIPTHLRTAQPPVRWGRPIYTPQAPRKTLEPIILKTTPPPPKTKPSPRTTKAITTSRIFFPWTTRPPPKRTTKRPQRLQTRPTTTTTTRAPTTTTVSTTKSTRITPRTTTISKRTRSWQRQRTQRPWHRFTRKPWRTKRPTSQTPPPRRRQGRTTWKWWFATKKPSTRQRSQDTTTQIYVTKPKISRRTRPTTRRTRPTTRKIRPTTRRTRPTTRKTRPTTRKTRPTTRKTRPTTKITWPTTRKTSTTERTIPTTRTPKPSTRSPTTKTTSTLRWRTHRPTTSSTAKPTTQASIYTKPTWNWWSRRVTKRPVTRTTRRRITPMTTTLPTTTTTTTTTELPTTTTRRTTPKTSRRSTKRTYPPWRYPPDQCGVVASTMIIGGRPSGPGRWPWQVSLQIIAAADPWHRCGGVLVDPLWVLTAAHCVEGPFYGNARNWRVVLSEDDLTRSSGREVYRRISRIVSHPGYLRASNFPNDIALLQLDDPVDVTGRYVRHACLPDREFSLSQDWNCWISGWGETRGTSRRYVLNELEVPILDNNNCTNMWSRVGIPVLSTQVCVGNGELGACYGDSGGPLMCEVDGVYVLGGVMSWLINNCTAKNFPNVFTRVSSYIDWIYYNMDVYNFRRYS